MAINIDCPRCRKLLSVPGKKAGSYASCPHCKGRIWVPKEATGTFSGGGSAAPPQPPPPQPPRQARSPQAPSTQAAPPQAPSTQAAPPQAPSTQAAPPQAPPPPGSLPRPGRKVARFISAEAAESTLKLADDGQLPELHLQESQQKEKPGEKSTSVNPLVLAGVLSLSVVLSISLVLIDFNPSRSSNVRQKTDARQEIENKFFGEIDSPEPLEEYQILLREAQRAPDHKTERKLYRKVLRLLRAERGEHEKGLTGSEEGDKRLEKLISILLSE